MVLGGLIFGGSHRSGGLMSMRLGIRLIVAMIGGGSDGVRVKHTTQPSVPSFTL